MPYPIDGLNGKVIERLSMGLSKTKIVAWLTGLANNVVTLTGEEILTNKTLTSPKINGNEALVSTAEQIDLSVNKTASLSVTAPQINNCVDKSAHTSRLYNLGAPIVADDDRIIVSADMKIGDYEIAAQPDVPRNVTVTVTTTGTTDTLGTITVTGTNYADEVISEEITLEAGSTVAGIKAFKKITSITGAGWVIDEVEGTADKITVGVGNKIGLPLALDKDSEIILGILGTAITAHNPTVSDPKTIEGTTIDMSLGTYDGNKNVLVFVVD